MNAAIDKLIESSNGRPVSIRFLKETGEEATLSGRTTIRWGNVPSKHSKGPNRRKYYLIYVPHKGYRRVNADAVLEGALDGVTVKNDAVPPEIAA